MMRGDWRSFVCYTALMLTSLGAAQNIPAFPQVLQNVITYAGQRIDTKETLVNLLTTLRLSDGRYGLGQNFSAIVDGSNGSTCVQYLSMIMQGISQAQPWAQKFVDANGKVPSDVIDGDLLWFGSFSECRSIVVPGPGGDVTRQLFTGKYCLAYIGNQTAFRRNEGSVSNTPSQSVLKLGICIPSSCNQTDAEGLFDVALSSVPVNVSVYCRSPEDPPLSIGAISVILICSVIVALIVCGTVYDVLVQHRQPPVVEVSVNSDQSESSPETASAVEESTENTTLIIPPSEETSEPTTRTKPGIAVQMLLCFSIVANMKKILTVDQKRPDTLTAVHGIRFISMSWVILGHTIVLMVTVVKNPLVLIDDYIKRFSFLTIMNATVSVDTFFLLSGILASYLMLKQINKSGGPRHVSWALIYIHRFWRLTPSYMLIIGIYTTLFMYLGSGPLYPDTPDPGCVNNWWQNLLYVNNFFNQTQVCLTWMWYLANDMQFFIISPLIIVALYKCLTLGVIIIGALILMNIIVVWILTDKYHFAAGVGAMNANQVANIIDWFARLYVRPYCRVAVYVIGVGLGYILYRLSSKPRIHVLWVITGWLLAAACCLSVLYGLYGVASGEKVLTPSVTAFYASFHRIGWALGVSWVIFACYTGYGGPVNSFLSWSGFVIISRLSYMAYILHPMVMMWLYMTDEVPIFFCDTTIIHRFASNLALTYALAFVLSVTLESPLIALEKVILPQKNR